MYCKNCGANNLDGAAFCADCGTRLNDEAPNAFGSEPAQNGAYFYGENYASPAKASKNKLIGLIAAGAAALAVIVLGIIFIPKLFSCSSARSIEKTCELYAKLGCGDTSVDVFSLFPDGFFDPYFSEFSSAMGMSKSEARKSLKAMIEEMADDSKTFKSARVIDTEKLDLDDYLDERLEGFDYYEYTLSGDFAKSYKKFYSKSNIKEVKEVTIEIKYRENGRTDTTEENVILIKVGNSWYLSPAIMGDMF